MGEKDGALCFCATGTLLVSSDALKRLKKSETLTPNNTYMYYNDIIPLQKCDVVT